MHRILASITSLEQHAQALAGDSEAYRPTACPRCQRSGPWRHGYYERKADRRVGVNIDDSLNPVAVPRFLCPACARTCSRLPACIAPRRWYDWDVQQFVLLMLLAGCSVHRCIGAPFARAGNATPFDFGATGCAHAAMSSPSSCAAGTRRSAAAPITNRSGAT